VMCLIAVNKMFQSRSCVKQEHSEGRLHDCITSECDCQYKELVHGRLHIKLDRFVLLKDTLSYPLKTLSKLQQAPLDCASSYFR